MGTRFYRFGRFRLNPQARELFDVTERINLPVSTIDCLVYLIEHRDRPVGRDELAAAVWGRVDVSEVSLSHAVMRLRRLLGDTGNEQRVIRTVPRLGYRWVMDDTTEETGFEPSATELPAIAMPARVAENIQPASVAETRAIANQPSPFGRMNRPRIAIALLALVAFAGIALLLSSRSRVAEHSSADSSAPTPAMVLPVDLDAPDDSSWVRLGLMDLVATELRRGGIATAPSETVVALAQTRDAHGAIDRSAFATSMIVQPTATYSRAGWSVRLEARDARRTLDVDAQADDPIKAGRKAADELLIKLGRMPPNADSSDLALAQATLRQRVNAAVLSGQLDVARSLIATAAPALQATPEIALARAKVDFFAGNYEQSRRDAETLLADLPADAPSGLRGRALNTLGASNFRQGRIDEAAQAYAQSVRLTEGTVDADVLANAYIGSGGVASQRMQLDEAAAEYGRARTLLELGNDAFGVAAVDLNLGMNALQRGQPAAALPILRGAADRFEKLAGEDALAATLVAIVDADLAVLDHKDALAVSERFAALQARGGNGRERWELTLARARALAAVGRLAEADTLLARIEDAADAQQDAVVRAQGNVLAADIALDRGDCAHAADFATTAMTPTLERALAVDYARAWRYLIVALQCNGQAAAASDQATKLARWSADASAPAIVIEVLLAGGDQAATQGSRDDAVARYAQAMTMATQRAIPDEIVDVGLSYVRSLLAAGRVDEAASVNGRIANWADRDARAAIAQASVYAALNRTAAADAAFDKARVLAGERSFTELTGTRERTAGP